MDVDVAVFEVDGQEGVHGGVAEEGADAVFKGVALGEAEDVAAFGLEAEGDGGVREGDRGHGLADAGELGGGGAEELFACGDVEEEVADAHRGALRVAGLVDGFEGAADDVEFGGDIGLGGAGNHPEAGNARDGGNRFASEAKGGDALDVFGAGDLAGGLTLEGGEGVGAVHPTTVVQDFDSFGAAAFNGDFNAGRLGVEGILDEFFHDRGGAFYHFAGGDLVGNDFGEDADLAGGCHWGT